MVSARVVEREKGCRGGVLAPPRRTGLFAHQDGDDECAFRESSDQERLDEHFAGRAGIATDGFAGFEADESEGDGGAERGAEDGDVTCHVSGGLVVVLFQGFGCLHSLNAMFRRPKSGSVSVFALLVGAHERGEYGGEKGKDESLDGTDHEFEEIEREGGKPAEEATFVEHEFEQGLAGEDVSIEAEREGDGADGDRDDL